MLADGGNAIDAALAANLVLGVVTPYMCGVGGDLLAIVWDGDVQRLPRRRPRAGGRDARRGARPVGRARRCRRSVRTPCTVPGAVDGWFTLLERWGTRSFGEVSAARAALRRATGSRSRSGARGSSRATRCVYEHFGLHDFTNAYGDLAAGIVGAPARARAHDPRARRRRSRRVLPRPDRRRDRRARCSDAGGFMTAADVAAHAGAWVEPLRATVPRRRDPRAAAADAGHHRARGAAHRRRPRPRRRRPRP